MPLAIVGDKGKLYLPIAADHKNQNARLLPFIEKKVEVEGTLKLKRGRASGVVLETFAAAE